MVLRRMFVFLISSLLCTSLLAQESNCTILNIYRPSKFSGSLAAISVFVNDREVGSLVNNSRIQLQLPEEGSYRVSVLLPLRGETYRKRSEKTISVNCSTPSYIQLNLSSLLAEGVVVEKDETNGSNEWAGIPKDKTTVVTLDHQFSASSPLKRPAEASTSGKDPDRELRKEDHPEEKVASRTGTSVSPSKNTVNTSSTPDAVQTKGKAYALIIGVNNYHDSRINDLDQPIQDAEQLYTVLLTQYTFESDRMKFLKNPTKQEITKWLDYYFEHLSEEDNLLIFYAGHGYWDEKFQQGYWLASDAQQSNRGTWLSNGTIRDYMRAIPSRHSLLVTDACFGGGIFKSRAAFSNSSTAINQLYRLPSRKAMTSGAMSEVPDKSVFIQYLVKRLEQNQEKYLSSEQLFASFKIAVINNSANGQVPQFGEVKETGDEGGDFIFIRK